jgi:hypothetical protein
MTQIEILRRNSGANAGNIAMGAPPGANMANMVMGASPGANMANIAIGLSTPKVPTTPWSYYAEAWARDQSIRENEGKLFERIKKLSISRIEEARELARQALDRFPYSSRIKRITEILAPPQVRVTPSSNPSRKKEFEWIKANKTRYKGQWVALYENRCLAMDKSFAKAKDKAREIVGQEINFMLVYLQD